MATTAAAAPSRADGFCQGIPASVKEDDRLSESQDKAKVVAVPSNDDEDVFRPLRRRRSGRDTNRILLSASRNGSLQFRRLEELFFNEEQDERPQRRRRTSTKQLADVTLRMGKFSLERVFCAPNIYVIDNFLSPNDLEYLQQAIKMRQFSKSFVDNDASESILDDTHRTSTFLSFAKQENAKVAAMEQKAAQLLGCYSTDGIEPLQLVRYMPGEFFGVHHDMGDYNEQTGEVALPPKSVLVKRRLVTIFCYLNNLPEEAGGCTGFPSCDNLRVQPKAGRAVVFCNVTAEGLPDPRTIHAGEVVEEPPIKKDKKQKKDKKKDSVSKKKNPADKSKDAASTKKVKKAKSPIKYGLNIWVCES